MVKDTSAIFVAGPPVVERLGETRTRMELGGHDVQVEAGTIDDAVDSEEEAFPTARAGAVSVVSAVVGLGIAHLARRTPIRWTAVTTISFRSCRRTRSRLTACGASSIR